jgi:molybdopterin molybdotransferase
MGQNLYAAPARICVQARPAIRAGKRCGPAELGLIASLGIAEVGVRRRLRVAFFSTGDETRLDRHAAQGRRGLRQQPLHPPRHAGAAGLRDRRPRRGARRAGGARSRLPPGAEADAIVTSGGVSVGEADFIRGMMAKLGEVAFWKIAMRPGRPMAFGRIGNSWLFGLPGNPVAVMVTFYEFVREALLKLSGVDPGRAAAALSRALRVAAEEAPRPQRIPARRCLQRQRRMEGARHRLAQGSGVLSSMSEANCFIVLPEDSSAVQEGDTVFVQPFHGLI